MMQESEIKVGDQVTIKGHRKPGKLMNGPNLSHKGKAIGTVVIEGKWITALWEEIKPLTIKVYTGGKRRKTKKVSTK